MGRFAGTPLMARMASDAVAFESGLRTLEILTGEDPQAIKDTVLNRGRKSASSILTVLGRYIDYARLTGELLPDED